MSTTRTQTQPPSPTPWPSAPLIRVIKGYETGGIEVRHRLAMRGAASSYRLEGGGLLVPGTGDVIETWEEMSAVPAYRASQIEAGPCAGTRSEPGGSPILTCTSTVCRHTLNP